MSSKDKTDIGTDLLMEDIKHAEELRKKREAKRAKERSQRKRGERKAKEKK